MCGKPFSGTLAHIQKDLKNALFGYIGLFSTFISSLLNWLFQIVKMETKCKFGDPKIHFRQILGNCRQYSKANEYSSKSSNE